MRLSTKSINTLKLLLKEQYGLDCNDEQAQEAGVAIMRFVLVKAQREYQLTNERNDNGN